MRDYINRLSRGKSIIEVPKLSFDGDSVAMDVACGSVARAGFKVTASDAVKGMVYADDVRINVLSKNLSGTDINIEFEVDATEAEEKDEIEGRFTIVCGAGEKEIPYVFTCTAGVPGEDDAGRKENVTVSADELSFETDASVGTQKYTVMLNKTGWGSVDIRVSSDADFLEPVKTELSTDDFTGDRYGLEYMVDMDKLHAGRNYGYLYIKTYRQLIRVAVTVNNCACTEEEEKERELRREGKLATVRLTQLYLQFRMKKLKKEKWVADSIHVVDRIRGLGGGDVFYDLVMVQLFWLSGRSEEAETMLERLKGEILGRIDDNVELYCYYLYVSALVIKSEEYTVEVERQVRKYYENGYDTYRLLWILFYLSDENESNKSIRLIRIKDMVSRGCNSPVMYMEAINIMNSQPVLLRVFNDFEVKAIEFGCRHDIISKKLAEQIAVVMNNERNVDFNLILAAGGLYSRYDDDELLSAIVTHMIRLGVTGKNAFGLYERAVLRELRITRLYEYYIASMEKDIKKQIPKIVLMYFSYDNMLGDYEKAFLYANIVFNRGIYKDVYENCSKLIEIFVYEQLKEGNINDYLSVLYKHMLGAEFVADDTGEYISRLRYVNRICCFDDDARAVVIRHRQLTEPVRTELAGGVAYVYVYSNDCEVLFECEDGVLRNTIDYEIERVFDLVKYDSLWESCESYGSKNAGALVYESYALHKSGAYSAKMLDVYKAVKRHPDISDDYKKTVNTWMIDYYSNYYALDDFWHEYPYIDTDDLSPVYAHKLIEVLVNFSMYSQAYELTSQYGYRDVSAAKLLKMTEYILKNVTDARDSVIDGVTGYIFREHIFNETTLAYMSDYFNGTNEEMYNVWKAGNGFNVNMKAIAERLLAQMMYTGVHTGRLTEVFTDYYAKLPDMLIVKAYLSYNSQLYLVRQKKANDIVFRVIEECMHDGYGLPECCYVAWLKDISKNTAALADNPVKKELAQKVFDELCGRDRIYGFFRKFEGTLDIPYNAVGVTVLECNANPESRVTITYSTDDGDNETTEVMTSNGWGIFTARFCLFYGDRIKYYYTVDGNGENTVSDAAVYEYGDVSPDMSGGKFDAINDCLASRRLHDLTTLRKLMNSYCVEDYVTKQMFKPI